MSDRRVEICQSLSNGKKFFGSLKEVIPGEFSIDIETGADSITVERQDAVAGGSAIAEFVVTRTALPSSSEPIEVKIEEVETSAGAKLLVLGTDR